MHLQVVFLLMERAFVCEQVNNSYEIGSSIRIKEVFARKVLCQNDSSIQ